MWDVRFLKLAEHIAQWSKDPSTKCGAVIVRPDRTIASMGYNGFPRGMLDSPERLESRGEKYKRIIHAEMNALLFAREPLSGYVLYTWPVLPCCRCAVHVIQTGIIRVHALKGEEGLCSRHDVQLSREVLCRAGIRVEEVDCG